MNTSRVIENRILVQFNIELRNNNKETFNLKELIDILDNVELIHRKALLVSQDEYSYKDTQRHRLQQYHLLKIDKIGLNSPLRIILSYYISPQGVFPYFLLLKTFFRICERYGNNTKELEETMKEIVELILNILGDKPTIRRRITLDISNKKASKLKEMIESLLRDKSFKRAYDFFCKTGIEFTELISTFEILGEQFDLDMIH